MAASLFGTGGVNNANVHGSLVPQTFTATAGQTLFTLTAFTYSVGTGSLLVFINGSLQSLKDYTETSTGSFTLVEACLGGESVLALGFPETTLDYNGVFAALASTAAGEGAWLVGYKRPEAGAQNQTVDDVLDQQAPSVMSLIPAAQHAAIYAGTSTYDVSAALQALIDTGKPFTLPGGAKFYCSSSLNWKSGAKMICSGDEYLVTSPDAYRTRIVFDADLVSSGIVFAPSSGKYIKNWAVEGVVLDTTRTAAAYSTFKMFDVQNAAGGGVFQFRIKDVTVQHCYAGFWVDDGMFSFEFQNVSVSYVVRGFVKTTTNWMTSSDVRWLKFFHVFEPIFINNATYMDFACFFDFCGLQAVIPIPPAFMTDRMPILFRGNAAQDVSFSQFGIENSKAVLFRLENYSTVSANISYYQPTTDLWGSSAVRISNITQAQQALFSISSSWLKIGNMRSLFSTANSYPTVGAWGSGTNYFSFFEGDASTRLTIDNSIIDMAPYAVCSSGLETYLSAPRMFNGAISFGNAGSWRQDFNYTNGYVVAGSITAPDYHFFQRNKTFVEGDEGFRITAATAASSVRVFATNGTAPNTAIAALKVPAAASNSRAINAGGTINASGADYAEYEQNNGLVIAKGAVVGFKADGTLTLTFADAVRFGVKSTNPSLVGGDDWFDEPEPTEPDEDATDDDRAEYAQAVIEFRQRHEAARLLVDRIAYSGKVPCNVLGAAPGDVIVAEAAEDGSIRGAPITEPDFAQYRRAIGRVNRILGDGRAEVVIITH